MARRPGSRGVPGGRAAIDGRRSWPRPSRRPRGGSRPRTRRPAGHAGAARRRAADWDDPPAEHRRSGCSPASPGARRARSSGGAGRAAAVRVRRARADPHVPRHLERAAAAATTSRPARSSSTPSRPTCPRRPGRAWHADFADVDVAAAGRRPGGAAGLGQAAGRSARRAGTRRCCRPAPWPTCSIYLYWSAGAKDAQDGRTRVQQARRRHPGRRAAGQPAGDAAQRPGAPGLRVHPVRGRARRPAATRRCSTTGWPSRPTDWIRDGVLSALIQTRYTAGLSGLPVTPGHRQPDPGRRRRRRGILDDMIAAYRARACC